MNRFLIAFVIMITATFSMGSEIDLLEMADEIAHMYRINGQDNNYLEHKIVSKLDLESAMTAFNGTTLISRSKLKDGLRYCIFQTKGAYGEHFSNHKSWQLAGLWTSRIRKNYSVRAIYRLEGKSLINWEIISAPCALAIEAVSGEIILLQGMGVD